MHYKIYWNTEMEYDYLAGLTEDEIIILTPKKDDDQILLEQKRRLGEIFKEQRRLEQEKKNICLSMSDPESAQKLITLTTKAARSIMQSEITSENINEEPYKDFDQEEQEFFQDKKHKQIYNLHKKVSSDGVVQDGIVVLKEQGGLDLRSQRHKRKPSAYLGELAKSKRLADIERRQKESEIRLARLELLQKENDLKFDQIGNALLTHEAILLSLAKLGIEQEKLQAYALVLKNPSWSVDRVAQEVRRGRATLFRWLKEIKEVKNKI